MVVFPRNGETLGDYLDVRIDKANAATLFGTPVPKN